MNYKSYVGNEYKYDLNSAIQFILLTKLGLRAYHKLLDIGCGSLRAGRLFIPYLDKGCYCGIEPEKWLIEEGIRNEIGACMVDIKAPRFEYSRDFPISSFNEKFNFMLAYSVFTHASQDQIVQCLTNAEKNLALSSGNERGGLIISTFLLGENDYCEKDWRYPDKTVMGSVDYENSFVRYTEEGIHRMAQESNLRCKKINWTTIHKQTWIVFGRENDIDQLENSAHIMEQSNGFL